MFNIFIINKLCVLLLFSTHNKGYFLTYDNFFQIEYIIYVDRL